MSAEDPERKLSVPTSSWGSELERRLLGFSELGLRLPLGLSTVLGFSELGLRLLLGLSMLLEFSKTKLCLRTPC